MEPDRIEEMLREVLRRLDELTPARERPRMYEFKEAARLLSVHPKTISRMVRSGHLVPVRLKVGDGPGKSMIPVQELDRICRLPFMRSSGASEEHVRADIIVANRMLRDRRYDAAAASAELKRLRAIRKDPK